MFNAVFTKLYFISGNYVVEFAYRVCALPMFMGVAPCVGVARCVLFCARAVLDTD